MDKRPIRRHFAFAVAPAPGGWRATHVIEYPSRGQADKAMLTYVGRYGDAEAITLPRALLEDEVLPAALLGRPEPPPKSPSSETSRSSKAKAGASRH